MRSRIRLNWFAGLLNGANRVYLMVAILLCMQAAMLAWIAWRKSPGMDEPAHLAAGLSHWKFGRFDLYRVNPPLVRMVATLPMVALPLTGVELKTDWSAFTEAPYARPEFALGSAFATANGFDSFWYFTLCRWACIPIVLVGGLVCFLWARDLYGTAAGFSALVLWTFCPNILGNGAMITPDVGGAALGVAAGYTLWRWLRVPGWKNALLAGLALGLAELTKSTWIVLFPLYPLLWGIWCVLKKRDSFVGQVQPDGDAAPRVSRDTRHQKGRPTFPQLLAILALGVYLLNLGYGFENSFQPLGKFQFISQTLGGPDAHETPGNRFADSWLGDVPVPVPAHYLGGIDVQRYDFEQKKWSYLRGEQKLGGWWYYYLYAMAVKMPVGTLALLGITITTCAARLWRAARRQSAGALYTIRADLLDDSILLAPALVVLFLVSSQTGFSRYLRYVVPAFPFLYIWCSQAFARATCAYQAAEKRGLARAHDGSPRESGVSAGARPPFLTHCSQVRSHAEGLTPLRPLLTLALPALCLFATVASSVATIPHSLSYFNELAGGPENGPAHLLDANIDWGQDLLELKRWYDDHPEARPLHLAYFGPFSPEVTGMAYRPLRPKHPSLRLERDGPCLPSGWYAISACELHNYGYLDQDDLAVFRTLAAERYIGGSILLYHIPDDIRPAPGEAAH